MVGPKRPANIRNTLCYPLSGHLNNTYYGHSVMPPDTFLCRQLNWIIWPVFYIQFYFFSEKFFLFVNVRSASIKLVNTGNFYSQSDSTIHSSSSNFTEYHVTVVVKEKRCDFFTSLLTSEDQLMSSIRNQKERNNCP